MPVILPGDAIPSSSTTSSAYLKLGPGLKSSSNVGTNVNGKGKERAEEVVAMRAGLLGHLEEGESDKWWVEGQMKRVRFSVSCIVHRAFDVGITTLGPTSRM
jgi:hypothetical protein